MSKKQYLSPQEVDVNMEDLKIFMRLSYNLAMSNVLYSQFYDIQQDLHKTKKFTLDNSDVSTGDIQKIQKTVDSFLDRLQHIFRRLGYMKNSNENEVDSMLVLSDDVLSPFAMLLCDRFLTCVNHNDADTLNKLYKYLLRLPTDNYIDIKKEVNFESK